MEKDISAGREITTGSVMKKLVYFSVPYFISYFLQTLYGLADLFIIGKYGSVADITSVSIGSQVMHMLTVMIVGLAMGATVTIGRFVGADNKREAGNAVGNTVTLFTVTSLIATVILYLLAKPDMCRYVNSGRGGERCRRLPQDMLSRHSFYHGIQCYKLGFQRNGRLEDSDALCRCGVRRKYRT